MISWETNCICWRNAHNWPKHHSNLPNITQKLYSIMWFDGLLGLMKNIKLEYQCCVSSKLVTEKTCWKSLSGFFYGINRYLASIKIPREYLWLSTDRLWDSFKTVISNANNLILKSWKFFESFESSKWISSFIQKFQSLTLMKKGP